MGSERLPLSKRDIVFLYCRALTIMSTGEWCKAFRKKYTLFFLFSCFCISVQEIASQKPCAYFAFGNSTMPNSSVAVTENTTVTFVFYLKNKTCINMENSVISIGRLDTSANSYTPQCDIVLKNGTCRNTTHEHTFCGCLNTFGAYKFSKIVSKSDITWWKWMTKDGLAESLYVRFNETHTDWQLTSVLTTGDQTSLLSSKGQTTHEECERVVTVTFPVTTNVSSTGHAADERPWMFVIVGLSAGLIIIVKPIV